ncbi:hypothetical protein ACH5RR_029273 [Cinchona calisaya]|uniref:Uncharacterized protein n=1 Tax=Cinchona calisaya TaxID=153742 RepID=A0ABD2YUH0_9GENT
MTCAVQDIWGRILLMVIVSLRVLVLCGASLVLGHPLNCQACLDIALKIHLLLGISGPNLCFQYSDLYELILRCAVHPQDDIRAKAIRLVARKLYVLGYIVENSEQFATRIFLLALDRRASDVDLSQSGVTEQRIEREGTIEDLMVEKMEKAKGKDVIARNWKIKPKNFCLINHGSKEYLMLEDTFTNCN